MLKIGKDYSFYELLDSQADVACEAAEAFLELVRDFGKLDEHADKIGAIEKKGDQLTRELQRRIATTFITPLDKEDLRDLSQALDDVTDYIEAATGRAHLYNLSQMRPDLEPLAGLLVQTAYETRGAVGELRNGFTRSQTLIKRLDEIHELENRSDHAFRSALARLFDEGSDDPLRVIKWKEIYDRIETAVDKCEDIAKILGTIYIKYA